MAAYWTIASGAGDVNTYYDEESRDRAIVETIRGYKDNPGDPGMDEEAMALMRADDPDDVNLVEVTIDNWRDVLDRLNEEMDAMGEAHYMCEVKEHDPELDATPAPGMR